MKRRPLKSTAPVYFVLLSSQWVYLHLVRVSRAHWSLEPIWALSHCAYNGMPKKRDTVSAMRPTL